MAKPARPELVFHSFDDMIADADNLRDHPYEKAGQWDLAMILDHLAKALSPPPPGTKPLPRPLAFIARFVLHQMAKRTYYPSIKFPSPKAMHPAAGVPLDKAYADFRAAIDGIRSQPGPMLNGTPFGALLLADFIKVQLLHGAHHLGFLKPRSA